MKKQNTSNRGNRVNGEGETVDKIRDIIFGSQMEEYEARFEVMEEQFDRKVEAMRKKAEARMDQIAERLEKSVSTLQEAIRKEATTRTTEGMGRKELSDLLTALANEIKE